MSIRRINQIFSVLVLLIAAICIIQPVLGANGTVTIAYRGSGGSYIGDTVIFDGKNTVGNITFLRITGPGSLRRVFPFMISMEIRDREIPLK